MNPEPQPKLDYELVTKIQRYITIDPIGDYDLITIRSSGETVTVPFSLALNASIDDGRVTLPDGTPFDSDSLQAAFECAFIEATGHCVLEHDYLDAGFPELARMMRQQRGD